MLKAGIRRQTIANRFVPVVGGSAFKNKGVQYLVDAVIDYLPSPLDIPPRSRHGARHAARRWRRRQMTTPNSARSPLSCGATHSLGSSVFFRVYSGSLSKGDTVYNSAHKRKRERISAPHPDPRRTSAKTSTPATLATSPRSSESRTSRLATHFAMRIFRSCSSRLPSPIPSSRWRSSRRQSRTREKNGSNT